MSAIISTTYHTSLSSRSHTTYVVRELERYQTCGDINGRLRLPRYGLTNVIALIDAVLYLLLSHTTATFQLSFKWNLKKRTVRACMTESKSNRISRDVISYRFLEQVGITMTLVTTGIRFQLCKFSNRHRINQS